MEKIKTIILAAGAGTRMHSDKAKVLHRIAGKNLLEHILDVSKEVCKAEDIAVIIGHQKEAVKEYLPENISYFVQEEQLGTGHALLQAEDFYKDQDVTVLVLNGDAPLVRANTLQKMIEYHQDSGNALTMMTTEFKDPTGYGRIIKDGDQVIRIVEERDASDEVKAIKEINAGIYCFNSKALESALRQIQTDNSQGEYYLTDAAEIIRESGERIGAFCVEDSSEIAAVNSRLQLAEVGRIFRERINSTLMENGVTILAPENTYIDSTVKVGKDTIIYPGALIEGNTVIGRDCVIGLDSHIRNSQIADHVIIENSTIYDSSIDSGTEVGPYAYIRPNSIIGKDTKIGDFVEVKNSVVGDGTKASHLTYIGDADVGKNVNLGCGTVFVNYNGKSKNRTIVEDDCFIGCNTNLVAPVTVRKGSYTAAGSTITDEVPEDTLAIARTRQINKENFVNKMAHKK